MCKIVIQKLVLLPNHSQNFEVNFTMKNIYTASVIVHTYATEIILGPSQ